MVIIAVMVIRTDWTYRTTRTDKAERTYRTGRSEIDIDIAL